MDNVFKAIKYLIIILFIIFIITFLLVIKNQNNKNKIILQDTTYNHIILDTINKTMRTKEEIIIDLKYRKDEDIKNALNADCTTAVNQFKELVTE